MAVPIGRLASVNVYALEAADGLILVDAGWGDARSLTSLEAGLASFGASLADIRGVLFTHAHDDHYGLAGSVRERSGAWLALHEAEAAVVAARRASGDRATPAFREWLEEAGADSTVELEWRGQHDFPMPEPDRLLTDGQRIEVGSRCLTVMHTPGHSPGHVCFVDAPARIVFTGDHVLPKTTPNVSVFPGGPLDPLSDYLDALARIRRLGDLRGFPGHGDVIASVSRRAEEILAHHNDQLAFAHATIVGGADTVAAVAEQMPWSRPWSKLRGVDRILALGEARAHLVTLERRGSLRRVNGRPLRWEPLAC